MRWYWLSCPQCGWKANEAVSEEVADKFTKGLQYCRHCDAMGKPRSRFVAREVITSTLKGHGRGQQ